MTFKRSSCPYTTCQAWGRHEHAAGFGLRVMLAALDRRDQGGDS